MRAGEELPAARRELLSRYRELLTLARRPVFLSGLNWDLCYCCGAASGFNPDRHFVFMRYDDDSAWLVFCNLSAERASALIPLPGELISAAGLSLSEVPVEAPAHGYAMVRCRLGAAAKGQISRTS